MGGRYTPRPPIASQHDLTLKQSSTELKRFRNSPFNAPKGPFGGSVP